MGFFRAGDSCKGQNLPVGQTRSVSYQTRKNIVPVTSITRSIWGCRLIAGVLSWLVPFLVAVPFYGRDGTLMIDPAMFKSIMIVVASITAAILIV